MKKPMIALTARSGDFDGQTRIFDNQTYFDAIAQAGGIPVLVTYGDDEDYKMIAERFDGLMVTGGEDLDPALFHQPAHPSLELTDPRLDTLDLRLIQLFAAKGKPILGICRGIQSINVAFGGTLIQDLNTQYPAMRAAGHQQHKAVPKPDEVDLQQLSFFDTVKDDDIIRELDSLELSTMTPLDAMNTLYRLQTKLKNRWKETQ